MKLIYFLLDILFPPKCILCGELLGDGGVDLCRECRKEAPVYSPGKRNVQFLDSITAVWYYKGHVRNSLVRYKFSGARQLSVSFGRLLAMEVMKAHPDGLDVLTWVPVSYRRKLHRGYDQVELIARALGKEIGMKPVRVLRKVRHNKQQSKITDPAQRRANVLGVYRVENPEAVLGKRVLLVDDILTTGATASEAARMLLTAGCEEVHCAAVAVVQK